MKNVFLFPNRFKKLGWFIFIPSLVGGIALLLSSNIDEHYIQIPFIKIYDSGSLFQNSPKTWFVNDRIGLDNIIPLLLIVGGILAGFSREKNEDEFINLLRLKSLFWSFLVSYSVIFLLYSCVFGMDFLLIMPICTLLPLVIYIFRFQYLLFRNR